MDYLFDAAPAEDVAAWLKQKAPLKASQFQHLLPELRALSFTVSGIEAADALQDLRDTIATFPEGERFADVQKKLASKLGQYITDPQPKLFEETDEEAAVRKGQLMNRARFLLRHHGTQAYAVAAFKDLDETRDVFPYWKYLTVGDEHVRDSHKALEGKILPHDDPFWQTHFPPWEYGCRCQVVPVTKSEYNRTKQREDEEKTPEEDRATFSEAGAKRLRDERQVLAKIGGEVVKVSVAAPIEQPHEDDVYVFNPHTLAMPLEQIMARYDEDTRNRFEQWAKITDAGNGYTIWQWLANE